MKAFVLKCCRKGLEENFEPCCLSFVVTDEAIKCKEEK